MTLVTILLVAVALGVDAFSVAMGIGAANHEKPWWPPVLRLSLSFGLFQFSMAVLGWFAGFTVVETMETFDHWVAFGLLALIGGKMIYEGLQNGKKGEKTDPTKGLSLLVLSVATSIDSLAVGFSFSVLKYQIFLPAVVIGVICFIMTVSGMVFGRALAKIFGKKINIFGGLVLIAIGVKILIEHWG
ncbi:MAG TPA: manganese efflux pump MntP family protein [Smithellaceae bacterium]|nr:MAG: putative manganese efflux pump MntP [Deltaproteobacteria bacterium ADurb.BinA014]HNV64695.1 manganese efflux pump MntP family protein [Smithellaceae bacterium]HOD30534.1 manganese efflux pump MntP family protein [Smithellaceae bacterium]HOF78114.1 manganese efflux pump MntP family protein [Smithellaceae bacterium]HOM68776.1 manganese efflux pump MntP family protein [Smithellaceae bacterium]